MSRLAGSISRSCRRCSTTIAQCAGRLRPSHRPHSAVPAPRAKPSPWSLPMNPACCATSTFRRRRIQPFTPVFRSWIGAAKRFSRHRCPATGSGEQSRSRRTAPFMATGPAQGQGLQGQITGGAIRAAHRAGAGRDEEALAIRSADDSARRGQATRTVWNQLPHIVGQISPPTLDLHGVLDCRFKYPKLTASIERYSSNSRAYIHRFALHHWAMRR